MTCVLLALLLAFLVVGPKNFPDLMRRAGKLYAELRRAQAHFFQQFDDQLIVTHESKQDEIRSSQNQTTEQHGVEVEVMPRAS